MKPWKATVLLCTLLVSLAFSATALGKAGRSDGGVPLAAVSPLDTQRSATESESKNAIRTGDAHLEFDALRELAA